MKSNQLNFAAHLAVSQRPVTTSLGLDPQTVTDDHFIAALAISSAASSLALPPRLSVRSTRIWRRQRLHGQYAARMVNFTTSAIGVFSGTTPYSRGADGRLTLKGGVRSASRVSTAPDERTLLAV